MTKNRVHIDFESRSECDLLACGSWVYSLHPSTEILCLVYAIGDADPVLWTPHDFENGDDSLKPLFDAIEAGFEIMAHNAFFERSLWENIGVARHGWPAILPRQWRCSAAKAAAHSLPRALGFCASALGLSQQKDEAGKRIMLKLSQPRRETVKDKTKWHSKPEDYDTLYRYCIQDVLVEREIDKALPDLIPIEQEIWFLDQKINHSGIHMDIGAVYSAIELADYFGAKVDAELKELTNGEVNSITEAAKLLKWVRNNGLSYIDDLTKGSVASWLEKPDLDPRARRALELRQTAKTSVAKYKTIIDAAAPDGRVRDVVMYYGAGTGRWTGKLVQFHNLPKGNLKIPRDVAVKLAPDLSTDAANWILNQKTVRANDAIRDEVHCATVNLLNEKDISSIIAVSDGKPADFLSSCIRGMLTAPKGKELFVADYNAIEARILYWEANYDEGIELFATGGDPYRAMAARIFNKPAESFAKDSAERQLGKQAVLGCGYQMGAKRFHETCLSYGMPIDLALAETAVKIYRDSHPQVKSLWTDTENAAIAAVRNPGKSFRAGRVKYLFENRFLFAILPSGRRVAYFEPRLMPYTTPWGKEALKVTYMGSNPVTRQWEREPTYAGKLVENSTQAVARDIMAQGMLNLDKAGYEVCLSVHDEALAYRNAGEGSVEDFCEQLTRLPTWAQEKQYKDEFNRTQTWKACPIAAEGWVGTRYRK